MSIFREKACNVISTENLIQEFFCHMVSWFIQKFAEINWDEYVSMVHVGLIVWFLTTKFILINAILKFAD